MSRIGKKPIDLPSGVNVTVEGEYLKVKGAKGELTQFFHTDQVSFNVQDKEILVSRSSDSKAARSFHGLYRNLLNNMIIGVTKGFSKTLLINGVGYRAEMTGQNLLLSLGYSTQFEYVAPEGVTLATEGNNKIVVTGIDKSKVGQAASEIRSLRPPEPYKGKGIQYDDEVIKKKVGKSGIK